ncbi:hypothetical protein [Bordetella genomosp. 13]|uniref:Uncharacterized protein n=1 Tax=Bordetella genomosp. 13 TaxID=463040 RepID=A0A1W6ZCX5_9BORD|nr:hypothetical protein [Bordetella genomosp. 13]ARP95147.1 hypothetical protein CAL15_12615 [Bordetella genomosp. 13]
MDSSSASAVAVLDSITKLAPAHAAQVVIAASHGGLYAAYCAAAGAVRAVIFNDAGVGKDRAGIAGLDYLQTIHIPAAAADYRSCRIGDGQDMAAHGRISHANAAAQALGCAPGMTVRSAAECLRSATGDRMRPTAQTESRQVLVADAQGHARVVGLDSVSLLDARDDGLIAVTASHGQRLAGLDHDGVKARPALVSFNDAGMGKDGAGASRLPLLQARGIAAVTVAAASARIGDARSCYETGVISCANDSALELGLRVGLSLQQCISALLAGPINKE